MKILIFIPGMNGGGAEKQCLYFFNELREHNFDVSLALFYRNKYNDIIKELDIPLILLKHKSFQSLSNLLTLNKYLKIKKYDLIISFLPVADLYVGILKMLGLKSKWIIFERNSTYSFNLTNYLRLILAKMFCFKLLANSNAGINYWDKYTNIKTMLYQNFIDFKFPKANKGRIKKYYNNYILYAGRLSDQKNIYKLVNVFKLVSDRYLPLIIGEGNLASIVKNEKAITFLDFQDDIFNYYNNAKAFFSLSKYEGTPNTVIENIICGNKVIVSDIKEHIDLLGKDYKFFLKEKDYLNKDKIIDLIEKPISNDDYSYFFNKYNIDRSTLVSEFKQLINEEYSN